MNNLMNIHNISPKELPLYCKASVIFYAQHIMIRFQLDTASQTESGRVEAGKEDGFR